MSNDLDKALLATPANNLSVYNSQPTKAYSSADFGADQWLVRSGANYNIKTYSKSVAPQAMSTGALANGGQLNWTLPREDKGYIERPCIKLTVNNPSGVDAIAMSAVPHWISEIEVRCGSEVLSRVTGDQLYVAQTAFDASRWEYLASLAGQDKDFALTTLAANSTADYYVLWPLSVFDQVTMPGYQNADITIKCQFALSSKVKISGTGNPTLNGAELMYSIIEPMDISMLNSEISTFNNSRIADRMVALDSFTDTKAIAVSAKYDFTLNKKGMYLGGFVTCRSSTATASGLSTFIDLDACRFDIQDASGQSKMGNSKTGAELRKLMWSRFDARDKSRLPLQKKIYPIMFCGSLETSINNVGNGFVYLEPTDKLVLITDSAVATGTYEITFHGLTYQNVISEQGNISVLRS